MMSKLHAFETIPADPALDSGCMDVDSCGMDAEPKLQPGRRCNNGCEEGPSTATAALFIGVLMGAVSTASMIWIAASIL